MKLMQKTNLDVWRFIAALMVVAIHVYPFTFISENFDYLITRVLFRIAVPIYLMTTGYFVLPKTLNDKTKLILYIKKISVLYLISIVIFLPINIYNGYFKNINILSIIADILFNGTFYHLWYFPALILGLLLVYFLLKKFSSRVVGIIVLSLYIIGLFGDSYYGIAKSFEVIKDFYDVLFFIFDYTRNGLFYVPIFLYIGLFVKKYSFKISIRRWKLLIVLNFLLLLFEGLILSINNIPRHTSMYISLIPLSLCVFYYLVLTANGVNKRIRKYSVIIYVIHPLLIIVSYFLVSNMNVLILSNSLANYLFVSLFSLLTACVIGKIT